LTAEASSARRERTRGTLILFTLALSVVGSVFFATQPWSDGRTAAGLSLLNVGLYLIYWRRTRDAVMARLLLFGGALGTVELAADYLCVRFTGTLDYVPARSAMLFESPWWMPLAWTNVGVQVGYVGARLVERIGPGRGALFCALLGAVNIPFYEEMAFYAHWWRYQNCLMVGHTPVYIVVAELLIGAALGPLARVPLRDDSRRKALAAGALAGAATIAGGLVGYGLVERIPQWLRLL